MEPIDYSFSEFEKIVSEIDDYKDTVKTEQDTRLKIIDPFLIRILGWNNRDIFTEEPTGDGFIDYKLTIDDISKLVVEAKKDTRSYEMGNKAGGRAYRHNGPVIKNKHVLEGINQGIRYCGSKNTELACVTNGSEWVVFRGSRLGDGKDSIEGMAFIFSGIESIRNNFKLFFDLLHKNSVGQLLYRPYFQEAEGQPIRSKEFKKTIRIPDSARLLGRTEISKDLDKIMAVFFRKLTAKNDLDMLVKCFVVTKESQFAEEKLARITDDLVHKVKSLDTEKADQLIELVEKVKNTERNEFILLIGTKGSGKSTFVKRFFKLMLPSEVKKHCVYININMADSTGDEKDVIEWLNQNLLNVTEDALFSDYGPTFDELQGMFFDEYTRWSKGTYKHLYENDKNHFKIEFGKHIEKRREQRPAEYIKRLVGSIVKSRKKIPCIIFDNADHFSIEFQEKVFQYARSIYENEICLIIMPITDKTSWQLSQQGALQSFDSESLYLPTPPPMVIFERRIKYIEDKTKEDKERGGNEYFFEKGIKLSLSDIYSFSQCLQRIFIETGNASKWMGNLSNYDIRSCLKLSRDVTTSSYLRIDELFSAFIANSVTSIPDYRIKSAIIKKNYDIYPVGHNEFVQNVYCITSEILTTPLLALRILRLLLDARHSDVQGVSSFIPVEQILDYFHSMTIERRAVQLCLDNMIKTGLCFSYDPTKMTISDAKKLEISPAGRQHYYWGLNDSTYIGIMLVITPIYNREKFDKVLSIRDTNQTKKWMSRTKIFIDYLLEEDADFTIIPKHKAFYGQNLISRYLNRTNRRLKVY